MVASVKRTLAPRLLCFFFCEGSRSCTYGNNMVPTPERLRLATEMRLPWWP